MEHSLLFGFIALHIHRVMPDLPFWLCLCCAMLALFVCQLASALSELSQWHCFATRLQRSWQRGVLHSVLAWGRHWLLLIAVSVHLQLHPLHRLEDTADVYGHAIPHDKDLLEGKLFVSVLVYPLYSFTCSMPSLLLPGYHPCLVA